VVGASSLPPPGGGEGSATQLFLGSTFRIHDGYPPNGGAREMGTAVPPCDPNVAEQAERRYRQLLPRPASRVGPSDQ